MKKRLFLLPLVGGFLLSGCTFNLFGKEITINFPWEKAEKQEGEGGGGSGGGSGEGGGGSGGGSGGGTVDPEHAEGTYLDLNVDHATTKSADLVVIEHNGVKLTIEKGSSTTACGGTDQKYVAKPLRVYAGQVVTIESDVAFSSLIIDSAWYEDNTYSDWLVDAINTSGTGQAAKEEGSNYHVVVTLPQKAKSFSYTNTQSNGAYKQNRFYSVELKA